MSRLEDAALLLARQALTLAPAPTAVATAAATSAPTCNAGNGYDGRIGLRISAIFVILVGSLFGAAFPVYAGRHRGVGVPEWAFFIAKYFGSGVIIATAFIHLLAPANVALSNPCLTGPITEYDWVEGIALITIFLLFFTELMAMRFATFGHDHTHPEESALSQNPSLPDPETVRPHASTSSQGGHTPGSDHLGHAREHVEHDVEENRGKPVEDYAAQMTAIFILEFGVVFHSVFVGLTLAVAGPEFNTLYIVLVFHQTFEGLGLGSRLAAVPWPSSASATSSKKRKRSLMPYFFALAYGLSTPIALAVGLGLRKTYTPGSQTALIVNGVFDSISAGILIYTGLVELMAHEFMFSAVMRRARLRVVMGAFGMMCAGAGSEEADLSDRIDGSPGEMGLKPTDLQPSDSKFASVPHLPCHNRFHIPVSVPVLKP